MQTRTHPQDTAKPRMAPNNSEASGVPHPVLPTPKELPVCPGDLPLLKTSDAKGVASKAPEDPAPFGAEVVGGHISFYSSKKGRWAPAEIVGFDPAGKHSLRVEGASGETWAALGSSKFKWIQRRADAEPNPSFAGSPRREDAVGRRARIFWPGAHACMHAAFACGTRVFLPVGLLCPVNLLACSVAHCQPMLPLP